MFSNLYRVLFFQRQMSIWGVSEDETVFLKSLLVILRVPGKCFLLFFLLMLPLVNKFYMVTVLI
jgi:hypothetical protein